MKVPTRSSLLTWFAAALIVGGLTRMVTSDEAVEVAMPEPPGTPELDVDEPQPTARPQVASVALVGALDRD